ncbi:MAG: alpha/beta fold hydrolase [Acidimicrobiia bacterium]|nr:alpha/beta fold hydrolase [Acidimicrobiia bacterium]
MLPAGRERRRRDAVGWSRSHAAPRLPHRRRRPVGTGRRWLVDDEPRAAVVLVHGFTATADDPSLTTVGQLLHERGLDVVTYDARGHGRSGGESTLGDLERNDVAAAVELARTRTDRVVLVGASMGAIAALGHAATDPALAGVVSVSCPSRWELPRNPMGVLSALMTRTPPGRAVVARYLRVRVAARWTHPAPPVEVVARLAVPAVFVHGTADRFIPAAAADELHRAAGGPSEVILVPGMGHAYEPESTPVIADAVDDLLARHVAPATVG